MPEFQSKWKPISFTVGEVYVIHRTDFDSPFEIHYRVPFGGAQAEKLKEAEPHKPKAKHAGHKVFVGNLPFSVTDNDLTTAFSGAGVKPVSVSIAKNPQGRAKGFAFVEFASADEVQEALKLHNNLNILGRVINVQVANS